MNSAAVISHHLFVAAIGNETRSHGRAARGEDPRVPMAAEIPVIPLELLDRIAPLPHGVVRAPGAGRTSARR